MGKPGAAPFVLRSVAVVFTLGVSACSSSSASNASKPGGGDAGGKVSCHDAGSAGVLATGLTDVSQVALDSTYAYWVVGPSGGSATDGAVRRVPLAGGCPQDVLTGLPGVTLHVKNGSAYVHDGTSITVAPVAGGTSKVLYAVAGSGSNPYEIVSDDSALYYALAQTGVVWRAAIDGSSIAPLAMGLPSPLGMAVDDTSVYVANDGDPSATPAYSNGSFERMAKEPGDGGAGPVETLATSVSGGQDVAVAAGHAFFLQFGFPPAHAPGAVWKLDLPGNAPTKILDGIGPGVQIETDGTSAWVSGFVQTSRNGLYRVAADGTATLLAPETATGGQYIPFALGPTFVVYVANGELRQIAK